MMKFTILFVALLFIAHTCCASKWQHQQQESCSKKLKRVNLKPCEKHMMDQIQGSDDEDDDNNRILRTMRAGRINYIRSKDQDQDEEEQQRMQKCCSELNELVSTQCQCKALQKIMENQSENLEEEKEKKQMERELLNMAAMCRLGPMIYCDLSYED